jgi:hypothetical protein
MAVAACSQGSSALPRAQGVRVHEWGTYTSVQSSAGTSMEGLHHTEEVLPPFVFARDLARPMAKGLERTPTQITQKLETPVLYFYGATGHLSVDVRFPSGVISEWFPDASSFEPAMSPQVEVAGGRMRWDVELITKDKAEPPEVPSASVWAPSRQVASLAVRVRDQDEGFIFYRGLARFERPIRVLAKGGGALEIVNDSDATIPAAFVLQASSDGGGVISVGQLGPRARRSTAAPSMRVPLAEYAAAAKAQLKGALTASGLYEDEAQAMVETWSHSYFQNPGLRVLYIAPRAWTDELLPISIDPPPSELVRTLVGRIEVLVPEEEAQIAAALTTAARGGEPFAVGQYGRFAEPKLRRGLELLNDEVARRFTQGLITQLSDMP